jgi:hypothetical protein
LESDLDWEPKQPPRRASLAPLMPRMTILMKTLKVSKSITVSASNKVVPSKKKIGSNLVVPDKKKG